jgi:hypothetical protein
MTFSKITAEKTKQNLVGPPEGWEASHLIFLVLWCNFAFSSINKKGGRSGTRTWESCNLTQGSELPNKSTQVKPRGWREEG